MQQTLVVPTPKTNGSVLTKKAEAYLTVFKTFNYELFKTMTDNRDLNLLHVKRLVESFNAQHLICPIVVNEKHEVIDGQHRLQASKETGMPVYFIMIPGYGIEQVQILNTNQKNWTKIDFLNMYCEQGKRAYIELKKFMEDFPDFGIQSAERLVRLNSTGRKQGLVGGQRAQMKDFEEGKLTIPNITKSYIYGRKVLEFKPFYSEYHRGSFVSALIPLFSSKVYNHKEMMHKMQHCPANLKLNDCNSVAGYRMQLEDIYNWKRQKENKVSFRYE
jgi:hypothetical protein